MWLHKWLHWSGINYVTAAWRMATNLQKSTIQNQCSKFSIEHDLIQTQLHCNLVCIILQWQALLSWTVYLWWVSVAPIVLILCYITVPTAGNKLVDSFFHLFTGFTLESGACTWESYSWYTGSEFPAISDHLREQRKQFDRPQKNVALRRSMLGCRRLIPMGYAFRFSPPNCAKKF